MNRSLNKLSWIEQLLPPEVESKWISGGLGYYFHEKLIMILTEASRATECKGKKYPFELWFGAFFPIVKIKQSTVCAKFPFLENHPEKKNALYLPAEIEEFEALIKAVIREIVKGNPLFGEPIKETAAEKRARLSDAEEVEIDTRKPRLFNTGPVVAVKKATKLVTKKKTAQKAKANKKSENSMMLEILKRRN